jgi:hypothetical protein
VTESPFLIVTVDGVNDEPLYEIVTDFEDVVVPPVDVAGVEEALVVCVVSVVTCGAPVVSTAVGVVVVLDDCVLCHHIKPPTKITTITTIQIHAFRIYKYF